MLLLVLGLLLFLGGHSVRVWGEPLRASAVARLGENRFKGLYSLVALAGFVLIVAGYGQARLEPTVLWALPAGVRHGSSLLSLVALAFIAATYVPNNHLKAAVGHPMVVGVGLWAIAHLLSNGTVADLLLFGGFLLWSVLVFVRARGRDIEAGVRPPAGAALGTAITAGVGLVLWLLFAFYLHAALFGVAPFGVTLFG